MHGLPYTSSYLCISFSHSLGRCCLPVAGNAVQTVKSVDAVKLITVRSTAFEAAAVGAGKASTEPGFVSLLLTDSVGFLSGRESSL